MSPPTATFSWVEVECLGACVNAPMVQINYDFYEDLTPESFNRILDDLAAGKAGEAGAADRPPALRAGRRAHDADRSVALSTNGGPAGGTHTHGGPATTDASAKKPSETGDVREAPAPKPPAGDASAQQPPSTRRE